MANAKVRVPAETIERACSTMIREATYMGIYIANGVHFARHGEVRRGSPVKVLHWIDLAMEFGR